MATARGPHGGDLQLEKFTVAQLKRYLRDRDVPVASNVTKMGLLKLSRQVKSLDISIRQSDDAYSSSILREIERKLSLEGGIIQLPHPYSIEQGWTNDYSTMQLTTPQVDKFFKKANQEIGLKTDGAEAKREGRSLYSSGHVTMMMMNEVSASIDYCFLKGRVTRETKLRESPWLGWAIINQRTWTVESAYCHCPGGLRGTCKHIAALLFCMCDNVSKGVSITSLPQRWGRPSTIHKPDFIKGIKISKAGRDRDEFNQAPVATRFDFDPRPPGKRVKKKIQDYNHDALADTGPISSILLYAPRQQDPERQYPHLEELDIVHTEECTTSELPTVLSLPKLAEKIKIEDPDIDETSFHHQLELEMQINPDMREVVEKETRGQTDSILWKEQRIGRITASKVLDCVSKVSGGEIVRASTSVLKDIMGHRQPFTSPATSWGIAREETALQHFFQTEQKKHTNFRSERCGLLISTKCPIIAASPDSVVSCTCCTGRRPVEVKNPWTLRQLTITQYAQKKETCLHVTENGDIELDNKHSYFYQIQTQMFALEAQSGFFVLKTTSQQNNLFVQKVEFNPMLMNDVLAKAHVFYRKRVIPELLVYSARANPPNKT